MWSINQNGAIFSMLSVQNMLSFFLVAVALAGLIYHLPVGENSSFSSVRTLCLIMGEVSLETSPKNIMIQDMINSENSMNTTEIDKQTYSRWTFIKCFKLFSGSCTFGFFSTFSC